jgi:hypothetical protein
MTEIITASRTVRARIRLPAQRPAGRVIRRIRPSWYAPPSLAEVERRLRAHPGLAASLTPRQREFLRAYECPDIIGSRPRFS